MTSSPTPAATVSHVGVSLGGLPVLRDVSAEVPAGKITAFLGGNGAGKTTLLRAILGLVPLQAGEIELLGTPLARFKAWGRVGYVPQRRSMTMRQGTVTEIVSTGRLSRRRPFLPRSSQDRLHVQQALETVGLDRRGSDTFIDLSGGQQQRALIARALAGEPEMLLLDEPFAGVDLRTQAGLAEVLRSLKAHGTTIVVILHELGELIHDIDSAVWLRNGRVIAPDGSGAANDLYAHGHESAPPDPPPPLIRSIGEGV